MLLCAKSGEFLSNFGDFKLNFRGFLVNICGNLVNLGYGTLWGIGNRSV